MACGKFAAGHDEQFEAIVKLCRVAAVLVDDGDDLFDVLAEQHADLKFVCAAFIQFYVAAQRVDFAVVGDVAVWMGAIPAGKRVGGEAGNAPAPAR